MAWNPSRMGSYWSMAGLSQRERRVSPRYSVVDRVARLVWDQPGAFGDTTARLIDLSIGGALMEVSQLPPRNQPIWICLRGMGVEHGTTATVVSHSRGWRGPYYVHLAFDQICPYEFFKRAVLGQDFHDAGLEPEPSVPASGW